MPYTFSLGLLTPRNLFCENNASLQIYVFMHVHAYIHMCTYTYKGIFATLIFTTKLTTTWIFIDCTTLGSNHIAQEDYATVSCGRVTLEMAKALHLPVKGMMKICDTERGSWDQADKNIHTTHEHVKLPQSQTRAWGRRKQKQEYLMLREWNSWCLPWCAGNVVMNQKATRESTETTQTQKGRTRKSERMLRVPDAQIETSEELPDGQSQHAHWNTTRISQLCQWEKGGRACVWEKGRECYTLWANSR